MPCKTGQSVPQRSSLHLLPTQVLQHIAGHHPNVHLIAREDGWIGKASICLRVAAPQPVQRQGGLREDGMVMYVANGGYKYHLALGSSTVQKSVYPFNDLSQAQQDCLCTLRAYTICKHNVYRLLFMCMAMASMCHHKTHNVSFSMSSCWLA